MLSYRRAKLMFDLFRRLTSRIVAKGVTRKPVSRIYSTYLDTPLASNKLKFQSFFSSLKPISLVQVGKITRTSRYNPFFGRLPNDFGEFRKRRRFDWRNWLRANRRIFLYVEGFVGCGVVITMCLGQFETIPYSKRTHFVLLRPSWENKLGECVFAVSKIAELRGKILPDTHPQTIRVRHIANKITEALQRGMSQQQEENQTIQTKGRRWWWIGSRVATSHLDGKKWEILVVDEPMVNAYCSLGGKIVVYTGLLDYLKSDEEIASVIGHEVGHAVARHSAEGMANSFWLSSLQYIFLPSFVPGEYLARRAFSRRMELEADYIGLLLLASAGYDPRVALDVERKCGKLYDKDPNELKGYLSRIYSYFKTHPYFQTHPSAKEREENLAQAHIMEEALSMYRQYWDVHNNVREEPAGGIRGFLRRLGIRLKTLILN